MTTTPTDLDALTALEQAATPAPWAVSEGGYMVRDTSGTIVAEAYGSKDVADAAFITAVRNAYPVLSERLTEQAYELSQVHEGNQRLAGELAKTRAELDAMTERRNEVRELAAKREAELIYLRAELTKAGQWETRYAEMLDQRDNALHGAAEARQDAEYWKGKYEAGAMDKLAAEANPATVPQLDEPLTCSVVPWSHAAHVWGSPERKCPGWTAKQVIDLSFTASRAALAEANPATTAEPADEHTVWDHYGPCGYCGVTTGPCLNPDSTAPWPVERKVPAPKPHPRRQLADAATKADLRPLTETEIEDAGQWYCPRCNGECACDQLDPAPDLVGNI